MCLLYQFCKALLYIFKGLFFFFWDGFFAVMSPCWRPIGKQNFDDDICLITGAAQGLGRLLALKLAERYAVLVLLDVKEEKLKEVAEEIKELGGNVFPYVCDCSSREDIYRVAAQVKAEVGDVSLLINNAGILSGKNIMDIDDKSIQHTFQVNTLSHFWTVKAFLPWMTNNNYGQIVQISSILAYNGLPKFSDYCASKAASLSFAETLYHELRDQKKTGVTVTCVCPFHMNTSMGTGVTSPLPCLDPEYVSERVIQAIEEKQFIVIIPRLMYLFVFLKSFLPTRTMNSIMDLMDLYKVLDKVE